MPTLHCLLLLLLLLLLPPIDSTTTKRLVVVSLAKGGTSKPFLIGPLEHDHENQPLPEPLPLNAPTASSQVEATGPTEGQGEDRGTGGTSGSVANEKSHVADEENRETQVMAGDKAKSDTRPSPTTPVTSTTTITSTPTTTTTTSTTAVTTTTTKIPSTTQGHLHPCHQSCLGALNATHLTPNNSLTLSAGSSLTLECRMPLVPELILEELLWLFHPGGTAEGRCSLTTSKSVHLCPGFPALSETDYTNGTLLQQTLILSGLTSNHTGDYMCQIRVTCCPGTQEHIMEELQEVQVSVKVWWTDYTLELVGTGVVASVLLVILVGVSVYGWWKGSEGAHYLTVVEVEAAAVLHLPLMDDQDTDSFASSVLDEDD